MRELESFSVCGRDDDLGGAGDAPEGISSLEPGPTGEVGWNSRVAGTLE